MVIMMVVTVMSDDDGGDSDSDDDDVKKITHTHKKNILSQLIITNDIYIVTNLGSYVWRCSSSSSRTLRDEFVLYCTILCIL